MKLSELDGLPSFALFGPGFTGGSFVWLDDLRREDVSPAFLFAAYEWGSPQGWAGEARSLAGLELDVPPADLEPTLDTRGHRKGVERILAAVAAGDLEQVNFTLRARLRAPGGAAVWATLCKRGVPRFASWLRLPDGTEVVSASPELFFEIEGDRIHVEPMKGTAPPGGELALEGNRKEVEELALVTAMVCRELEPICVPGSVEVPNGRRFVELPYAVQAVSDVAGVLLPGTSVQRVFGALHPGASITGVPREAAREMIAALEASPRHAYCGALAYVQPAGPAGPAGERRVIASMLIRTAYRIGEEWFYGVGGGITGASDPEAELAEVELKLGALR